MKDQSEPTTDDIELASDALLDALRDRIDRLDGYVNSREINELSNMLHEIECGEEAKKKLRWFLESVPEGRFDGNRRIYKYPPSALDFSI